jgi:hypothetical protein
VRQQLWEPYQDLKAYRQQPDPAQKPALERRFDDLVGQPTGYPTSLGNVLNEMRAHKADRLRVLERPEVPLPNNGTESIIRGYGKIQALKREFRELTDRRWLWLEPEEMVGRLNRVLRGWANYFCLGAVTAAYRTVTAHACHRLRQWLVRKYPRQGSQWERYSDRHLHADLGLLRLQRRPSASSCANA